MGKVVFAVILVHIIVCIICFLLRKKNILHKDENLMPFIIGVPVFGLLCQIIYEYFYRRQLFTKRAEELEKLEVNDVKYKRIEVEHGTRQDIIPLEEALLMNDTKLRRQMMLEILHKKPGEYVSLLQKAKNSNDTEVIHYATTMMMEVMTDYEKRLQECERAYQENPDDKETLREYIKVYRRFMKTGMVSGALKKIYAEQIAVLLAEYYEKFGVSRRFLFAEIEMALYLGNSELAEERLKIAKKRYTEDVELYKLYGQLYYDRRDYNSMRAMIQKLKANDIYLDRESKEWLRFWDEEEQVLG